MSFILNTAQCCAAGHSARLTFDEVVSLLESAKNQKRILLVCLAGSSKHETSSTFIPFHSIPFHGNKRLPTRTRQQAHRTVVGRRESSEYRILTGRYMEASGEILSERPAFSIAEQSFDQQTSSELTCSRSRISINHSCTHESFSSCLRRHHY